MYKLNRNTLCFNYCNEIRGLTYYTRIKTCLCKKFYTSFIRQVRGDSTYKKVYKEDLTYKCPIYLKELLSVQCKNKYTL